MPKFAPPDLREEVIARQISLRAPVEALMTSVSPELDLLEIIQRDDADPTWLTPMSVAGHRSLQGRIFWLDELDNLRWPKWKAFVERLQGLTRNQPRYARLLFIIELTDDLACDPPLDNGGIAVLKWDDVLSRYDMLQYAHQATRHRALPKLERTVIVELLAELAAFDPEVIDILASSTLEELLDCDGRLIEFGRARGWTRDSEKSWLAGSLMNISGEEVTHAAIEVTSPGREYRKWSALVRTIYVVLEQRRQEIILKYAPYLDLQGRDSQPEYPEIFDALNEKVCTGQIALPRGVLNQVASLRQIRNKLAHFGVPSANLISQGIFGKTTDESSWQRGRQS